MKKFEHTFNHFKMYEVVAITGEIVNSYITTPDGRKIADLTKHYTIDSIDEFTSVVCIEHEDHYETHILGFKNSTKFNEGNYYDQVFIASNYGEEPYKKLDDETLSIKVLDKCYLFDLIGKIIISKGFSSIEKRTVGYYATYQLVIDDSVLIGGAFLDDEGVITDQQLHFPEIDLSIQINDSIEDAIKDNLKTIKRKFKKFQKDQFKKDYINEQENSYLRKKNKRD